MMRLLFCLVRRDGISSEEFAAYWRSQEHREKIASLADLFAPDHYTDTLCVEIPDIATRFHQYMGRGPQYDAVLEFYWKDISIVRNRLTDAAVAQILKVLRDQSVRRVDPEKSSIFFTEMPDVAGRGM